MKTSTVAAAGFAVGVAIEHPNLAVFTVPAVAWLATYRACESYRAWKREAVHEHDGPPFAEPTPASPPPRAAPTPPPPPTPPPFVRPPRPCGSCATGNPNRADEMFPAGVGTPGDIHTDSTGRTWARCDCTVGWRPKRTAGARR